MTPRRFRKIVQVLNRRQPDLTVLMENVHKPHNLSAVVRSCDAVGVLDVHAISANSTVKLAQKTAGGNRRWITVHSHESIDAAAAALRAQGYCLLAASSDAGAIDFREADYARPSAIVIGSERTGLSAHAADAADVLIQIPMHGMAESLNVSVATALILFEAQRQRMAAGMYARCRLDADTYQSTLIEWTHPKIAAHCRAHGLPYPQLDADGNIVELVNNNLN